MNFTHLNAFYTVAKCKSFTRASTEINVSQSTLSLQVRTFEDQYDTPLLKRTQKGVELTDEGQIVYAFAQKIFSLSMNLRKTLEDFNSFHSGELIIGTTPTLALYVMPSIIHVLKQNSPDLRIMLYTGLSKEILGKVVDYEYHAGIVGRVTYPDNIVYRQVLNPRLHLITTDDMSDEISLEKLSNYPLILPERGSATRKYLIDEFKKRGISLNRYIDCENPSAIKDMVHRGMGGAFFPHYAIEEDVLKDKYRYIKVQEELALHIDLIYLAERQQSRKLKMFVSTLSDFSFPTPK